MQMPAEAHEWVSFTDEVGDDWMFDLTFMTSAWTCIFGDGCVGVLTGPTPELAQGCCSYGAHLTGDDDRARVETAAARLDAGNWQFIGESVRRGGPFKRNGAESVTRLVGDACIFLNRPGFPGGPGCALHRGAIEHGERPLDWKPDVCWQLPLRLVDSVDENDHTTHTLREWTRRDWGDGGAEFHWWCTDGPEAFIGHQPVYVELRDEIVEMVGIGLYRRLVDHIEIARSSVPLPHPALKKRA
ncbi:MAG: hypothetical protein JJE52_05645 [Acidimicrobiia bacterium]|nr:hypothetical protein [Acidimicrobiia bacterium]